MTKKNIKKETTNEEVLDVSKTCNDVKPLKGSVSGCIKLNIREKPDINSKVLSVVPIYSSINILNTYDDWLEIKTDDNIHGYCMTKYIKCN